MRNIRFVALLPVAVAAEACYLTGDLLTVVVRRLR